MNRANQGSYKEKKDEWDDDGDPIDAVKSMNFENVTSVVQSSFQRFIPDLGSG